MQEEGANSYVVSKTGKKDWTPKSKNHSLIAVGRHVWRPSAPMPLPDQVHPEQIPQDCIQVGFD